MVYTTYFQDLQALTKLVPQLKCSVDSQLEYYKQLLMTFDTVSFTIGDTVATRDNGTTLYMASPTRSTHVSPVSDYYWLQNYTRSLKFGICTTVIVDENNKANIAWFLPSQY